jgi:hypothetical protein
VRVLGRERKEGVMGHEAEEAWAGMGIATENSNWSAMANEPN